MAAGIEAERVGAVDVGPEGRARHAGAGGPIRVAVIGCGAVAREFHLPVLAGHQGVRLTALVDRDLARARELARAYGVDRVVADVAELAEGTIDAAVVATPPSHHAPCGIGLAGRGVHVLVEKPMALTATDAEAMVRAAEEAEVVLAVGLFRRILPSARLLRAALDSGVLGRPVGFDIECGGVYGWPAATLGNMRKDLAGGGVLIDMGSHVLDQLLSFLPGAAEVLDYRDDALGGIEADCELRLRIDGQGTPIEGRVTLSRVRELRNTVRVACERGTLELPFGENDRVSILPRGLDLIDPTSGGPRPYSLQARWADVPEINGYGAFRAEVDDWLDAIRTGRSPLLDGRSALPTVRLIEECYRRARPLRMPWVEEGFRRGTAGAGDGGTTGPGGVEATAIEAVGRGRGRVLVTGAAGFIGGRVAELLHFREGWQVRALVHNPGGAARLARMPVEMVAGDLRHDGDVRRAVEGCEAVVHCAIGTAYGQRREIFTVTVGGTQHLAEAARAAGVRRFVHVSTTAVHGHDVRGVIDESTPIRPVRGFDYAESKAEAERVVARAVRCGLPAVTLRLANIYGPFGKTLMVRPIQYLARGRLALVGAEVKVSDTVYVDNVAEAIARALEAPGRDVLGEVFAIGAEDDLSWAGFYGYYAAALGVPLRLIPAEESARAQAGGAGWAPARWVRTWYRGGLEVATSGELRGLARKVLQTEPGGGAARGGARRGPALGRTARRLLKLDAPLVYRPPAPSDEAAEADDVMTMDPISARVSIAKARRVLRYAPAVPRARAMELTLQWLRYAHPAFRGPDADAPGAAVDP
jgi:predicted dehydrogenase/nucleoside-diphosphate-sugar epimerase